MSEGSVALRHPTSYFDLRMKVHASGFPFLFRVEVSL